MNTFRLRVSIPVHLMRGGFHTSATYIRTWAWWKALSHLAGFAFDEPLPLSGSKPSLSLNKMCAHPLFTCLEHCQQSTLSISNRRLFWVINHQHPSLSQGVPPNRRFRECFIWYLGEKCKYHDEKCASKSPVLLWDVDKYNLEHVQNIFK